uniref:(northern house mosquito) hypothetical protein n=1 Tax=Culex pipiens TaxID=7175 RepID=A0A8D8JBI1_CULPI
MAFQSLKINYCSPSSKGSRVPPDGITNYLTVEKQKRSQTRIPQNKCRQFFLRNVPQTSDHFKLFMRWIDSSVSDDPRTLEKDRFSKQLRARYVPPPCLCQPLPFLVSFF